MSEETIVIPADSFPMEENVAEEVFYYAYKVDEYGNIIEAYQGIEPPEEFPYKYTSPLPRGTKILNGDPETPLTAETAAIEIEASPSALEIARADKLCFISNTAKDAYTGGFTSAATGITLIYDSQEDDQNNLKTLFIVTLSESFSTDPLYNGFVTIRAKESTNGEKSKYLHTKDQMSVLVLDLAKHISTIKDKVWELQEKTKAATTITELEGINWY